MDRICLPRAKKGKKGRETAKEREGEREGERQCV